MKLITCITSFNGLEFLPKSVEQFLKFSDEVLICYQDVSHNGERRNVGDFIHQNFGDKSLITITKYKPNLKVNFKENEMRKHSQMANEAREVGATHMILGAVDHFYDEKQVDKVLDKALQYDVSFTLCQQYYKHPTWQITPQVDWYMPFTIKLHPNTKFCRVSNYPVKVDPACKVNTKDTYHIFKEEELVVHNYGMIRSEIREKYINRYIPMKWGASKIERLINEYENYDINVNPGIEHYHGKKIKIVPNYFDL